MPPPPSTNNTATNQATTTTTSRTTSHYRRGLPVTVVRRMMMLASTRPPPLRRTSTSSSHNNNSNNSPMIMQQMFTKIKPTKQNKMMTHRVNKPSSSSDFPEAAANSSRPKRGSMMCHESVPEQNEEGQRDVFLPTLIEDDDDDDDRSSVLTHILCNDDHDDGGDGTMSSLDGRPDQQENKTPPPSTVVSAVAEKEEEVDNHHCRCLLARLPLDLTLRIYSYCDKPTLQQLLRVDQRTNRTLLTTDEAVTDVWKPLVLHLLGGGTSSAFVDHGRLESPLPSILLRYDPPSSMLPSRVDLDETVRCTAPLAQNAPHNATLRNNHTAAVAGNAVAVWTQPDPFTVQFHGVTGHEDRCVRANAAFPTATTTIQRGNRRSHRRRPLLLVALSQWRRRSLLMLRPRKTTKQQHQQQQQNQQKQQQQSNLKNNIVKPFLMPVTNPSTGQIQIIPTKRAYYEVTILPTLRNHAGTETATSNDNATAGTTTTAYATDCLSVGLSQSEFSLTDGGQPGWDEYSFGLHGDDGGLFHDNGGRVLRRQYYPHAPFHPGDTIGCGIDYECGTIFYTVNGTFTGHAFDLTDDQLARAWYPTVGIDTNHPVRFNFGQTAFCYQDFHPTGRNEMKGLACCSVPLTA
jgi:SPRY domain